MDVTNFSSRPEYVISLDAVDLNYIPTVSKFNSHGVTKIWTTENLNRRDNEYYEFEIIERKELERDGEGPNSQYTQIPCYICNINVPNIFLKDHINSNKHKTFKKIINVSLDRLKKVISKENEKDIMNLNKSIYFCASCDIVVRVGEKILHEESIVHKKSLQSDKILNDFLDLYVGNQTIHDNDVTMHGNEVAVHNNDVAIHGNKVGREATLKHPISKKEISTLPKTELVKTRNNLSDYVKFLNESWNFKDIKFLHSCYLELKTKSGTKVRIMEENFNSMRKISEKEYKCFLCITTFDTKMKWDHLYEKGHIDRIIATFKDRNCLRQNNSPFAHCAICNTIVTLENCKQHIMGRTHKQYLNEALNISNELHNKDDQVFCNPAKSDSDMNTRDVYNGKVNKDIKDVTVHSGIEQAEGTMLPNKVVLHCNSMIIDERKFRCTLCRIDISNHNFNIYTHLIAAPHIKAVSELTKKQCTYVHYHMDLTKFPLLECLVCKDLLNVNQVAAHVQQFAHKQKYNEMLMQNKVVLINNEYFCEICSCSLPSKLELVHCQTMRHVNYLNSRKNCHDDNVTDVDISEDDEISTESDDDNTIIVDLGSAKSMRVLDRLSDVVEEGYFWCESCETKVPNHNYNIYTHLTTDSHMREVNKLANYERISVHYHVDLTRFPILKCFVCEIELSEGTIVGHMNDYFHRVRCYDMYKRNMIMWKNNEYYCQICLCSIDPMHEVIHCQTRKHINKLKSLKVSV